MIWRTSDFEPAKMPPAGSVFATAFAGNERVAARLQPMTRVYAVDVSTGKSLWATAASGSTFDRVMRSQFSPDGNQVLTGKRSSVDSVQTDVRDAQTGEIRHTIAEGTGHFFFREGRPVAITDVGRLALKDVRSGRILESHPPKDPSPAANYARFSKWAFSRDGCTCAEFGLRGDATIWDLSAPDRTPRCVIRRHRPDSFAEQDLCAFSRDGSRLAAFDGARHLKMWDTHTGQELGHVELAEFPEMFAFDAKDRELQLYYLGREIRAWVPGDAGTRPARKLESNDSLNAERPAWWKGQHLQIEHVVQVSDDCAQLVYVSQADPRAMHVWNTRTGSLDVKRLSRNGAGNARLALSPNGLTCLIEESWGDVEFINLDSNREISRFTLAAWSPEHYHSQLFRQICISNDGTSAAWCEGNKVYTAHLSGGAAAVMTTTPEPVHSVVLSEDGRRLAIAFGRQIEIYDSRKRQIVCTLSGPRAESARVAFNNDGTVLIFASSDGGKIRLCDTISGRQLAEFDTGWSGICRVALSATGRWLAALDHRGQVRLWDTDLVCERLREAGLAWSIGEN
jgi:WD40 repeat protein